jgi:gramicidin S synthase 2/tyrocidine synthetase-3
LARGYLNNPALTAEKFVPNPFKSGEKLYKTGDLGRWHADGNIEYIGRRDDQVKIRGYRIELGEIENAFRSTGKIEDAAVICTIDSTGEKKLIAYLVCKEKLHVSNVRIELSKVLPNYMIPAHFVQLEKIPLTSNGKVDKKALPDSESLRMIIDVEYVAPRNDIEKKLVEIWSEVLGVDKEVISINSNFFELGGHSLKATSLSLKIYRILDTKVPLTEIFKRTTLQDLAGFIENVMWLKEDNLVTENLKEIEI